MTEEQEKILKNFELQIKLLMKYCDRLKMKNRDLNEKLVLKENEITKANEEIRELTSKYDNLKLAKIISTDDDEMKKTKKRLSSIVREIDKCIALLNE